MSDKTFYRAVIAAMLISFILAAWANHAASSAAMRVCLLTNSASTCHTLME